jgi:RNA polymerase sigma-70 factor, ECF subfamily
VREAIPAKIELRGVRGTLSDVEGIVDSSHTGLVAAAKAGDSAAFARLVEPYLPSALSSARFILGGSGDAADAVQDALISAWRDLPRLREPKAFGAWFRQHVVRSAGRAARRNRSQLRLPAGWIDPTDHLELAMATRQLQRAFDTLEPHDRVVLTLHYHLGLTNDETSRLLRVPIGTVKSRLHYALRRLRAAYDAEERT